MTTIGSVAVLSTNRVGASGATSTASDSAALAGATSGAMLSLTSTDLTIAQSVNAGGVLRLDVTGSLNINASIIGHGDISVLVSGSISQSASGLLDATSGSGTIDVASATGAIVMVDGAVIKTSGKNIRLAAATSVTVGLLDARDAVQNLASQANWGVVSIVAGGNILDTQGATGAVGVRSSVARLQAGGAIGNGANALDTEVLTLAAGAGAGGLFVADATGISVGAVGATVNRVNADGSLAATVDAALGNLVSGGALVLTSTAGAILANSSVSTSEITAAGNLLLKAAGDVTLAAAVRSSGGHLSINAAGAVNQGSGAAISTQAAGKTIVLSAAGGNLTMAADSTITSNNGDLALQASGDVAVATLLAGAGNIAIAGTNISDAGNSAADISGAGLVLSATNAIGYNTGSGVANALEIAVTTLAASSGAGGLFLTESDGLSVGAVTVLVNPVDGSGSTAGVASTAGVLNTLSATAGGKIVLVATSGDLTVSGDVASATGNVLLAASAGNLTVNNSITSTGGAVTLQASGNIAQAANIGTTGGASVGLVAGGAISMNDGVTTSATTNAGAIRYVAGGTLTLGSLSTGGSVSLSATSITDSGSTDIDVSAGQLRLVTSGVADGNGVGTPTAHLQLAVGTLAGTVAGTGTGGLYLDEADALTVGASGAISVQRMLADGTSVTDSDATLSGLSSGGNLVLGTGAGTLTINNAVTAAGNILLRSTGAASDVALNAALLSTGGNISVAAGRDFLQNAAITTATAAKTIDLLAVRSIATSNGNSTASTNGNIVVLAGSDVTIETLSAGSAAVSVTSTAGSILDEDSAAGESEVDITAAGLSLKAGNAIGSGLNHLETSVATLTAQTGAGGLFLTESDSVTVATLTVQANRVGSGGVAVATSNAAQSGLGATGAGAIVLQSNDGILTLTDAVAAGSGNTLLQAASGGLIINNSINGGTGSVTLRSAAGITQGVATSTIRTSGAGTIDVNATAAVAMVNGSAIGASGNIRVVAGTTLTIGTISSAASVSLSADGISDSGTTDVDVTASALRLVTTSIENKNGVGTVGGHLQLAVGTLAADVLGGRGLYLDEADGIVLDQVGAIVVSRVGTDGATAALTDGALSGLKSAGNLVLVTSAGGITVNSGNGDGNAVAANGNLLLKAGGATSDLIINAAVLNTAGNSSLNAGRDLLQNALVSTSVAGKTIDLLAGRDLTMANGSATSSNGNQLLQAGGSVVIETLNAGTAAISVTALAGNLGDEDGAGDTQVDIVAAGLLLNAGGAIGSGANALEITVGTLTAHTGAGGLFLTESDGLTVDTLAVQVNRVASNASATATNNAAQSDLTANGAGSMVLVASRGDIVVSDDVTAVTGNVLLQALSGGLTLNSRINAGAGALTLSASGAIAQKAAIASTGSVDVTAGGAISMDNGTLTSASANIRYVAGAVFSIGALSTAGNVSLSAASIVDSGTTDVDVAANALRLVTTGTAAGDGAGGATAHLQTAVTTLAASVAGSGNGGLYLDEADGITLDAVGNIGVMRVAANGGTSSVTDAGIADVAATGNVVLTTADGAIVVNDGDANGAGIMAGGKLLLKAGGGTADLILSASLASGAGSISLNAGRDLLQNAAVTTAAAGQSIDVLAARHIAMADGSVSATNAGNLRYAAGDAITVGVLDARSTADRAAAQLSGQAGWGAVSLAAGGAIVDGVENVTAVDVYASDLRLSGTAAGNAGNALETEVSRLSASVGAGGLFVAESGAIEIGQTAAVAVNRVAADATTAAVSDAAQAGLSSAASAVLATLAGPLTVNSGVAVAANLLLNAAGTADIVLNASLSSTGGNISLNAGRDILQNAAISTSAAARSIELIATRDITMGENSASATSNGNIVLLAGNNIVVETLSTGSGSVSITASTGSILDQDAAGDSGVNITAAGLLMKAGTGIGSGANHLEIAVGTLSAQAGAAGLYLTESDGVTVAALAVQANHVDAAAVVTATTSAAQADLGAGGNIVLISNGGTLTLNDGDGDGRALLAGGAGNVLLSALGAGASLVLNANAGSGSGHVTLSAANAITVAAGVTLATGSSGSGTLSLNAGSGAITMAGTAAVNAGAGSLRLAAGTDVTLGNLTAANVSVIAGSGAILNATGTSKNVTAANLRLQAGGAVGGALNHLTTAVASLSAQAAGGGTAGLYIDEDDSVSVTSVAVGVSRVGADGATTDVLDADQADLVTGNNGNIVLAAANGAIMLADGNSDGRAVAADGSGNVLLQAAGASGTLALGAGAAVQSGSGHITLLASQNVLLAAGANVSAGLAGDIDVEAGVALSQADGSVISTASGSIGLRAGTDIHLASLASVSGNVTLTAGGSILEDGDAAVDIAASGLRLSAGNSIGTLGQGASAIDLSVATLSARAGAGGISLAEASDITVTDVSVTLRKVGADGSATSVAEFQQSDLRTTANGSVVLNAGNFIILNEGTAAAGDGAVAADGSGNVLIASGASIILSADILSGSGHVSVLAASLVELKANAGLRTGGSGNIDVEAGSGAVLQAASSLLASGSGTIRVAASSNVMVGDISTGGTVSITAGSGDIGDADALAGNANDSNVDITAGALRLAAGGAIGIVDTSGNTANALETTVGTLSAVSGGAIAIVESDALVVGEVAANVLKVALDGQVLSVVDAAQADLRTSGSGGHIVLSTASGGLTLSDGDSNGSAITASGSVVLRAGGGLLAGASVAAGGTLTVKADGGITLGAGVTFSSSGGALSLDAAGGALTMDGTANAMASGASLRLHAAGDIALGNVSATNVSVVSATGALLNAAGSVKNLSAVNLRLQADDAIGSAARSLTTAVDIVSAASAGSDSAGIYLAEDDAIATGSVAVSVGTAADAAQADIVSGNNGNIVLTTVNGSITVNDGNANGAAVQANGSGQILLQAGGADLVANAGVSSGSGNLTIKAAGNMTLASGVSLSTGGASLSLDAAGGALTMDGAANATAIGGNLRLHAAGDITLGNVSAANVSVVSATGALLNAAGSSKNVSAETLRLQAGAAIGTAARSLSTAVGALSAHAASEIHVTEDDAVTIGSVGVTVAEFAAGGSNAVVDAAQAGLATDRSGSIALTTLNGDIVANANVTGGAGGVAVTAARGIVLAGGVTVSSGGALSLDAAGGALTMDGTANAMASGASLRLHAAGDIALGNVSATNVSVVSATGALLNAAGSVKNLSAVNLRLQADDAIGSAARSLTTAVDIVSAASAGSDSAGIYLAEDDAIATGSVAVSVGTAVDAAQADIVSGNNGNIVLTTVNGSITVNDGNANGAAVQANGSGQILLQAGGADLVANAGVSSGSGNLTIKAAGNMMLGAGVTVTVSTVGASLSLDAAGGALTMDGAANATAVGGNLRLHAAGDITLGNVSAANVSVVSATGALLNAAGSSKNVSAETLRLQAGAAIGTAARSLSTAVGTLSAHAASDIHVTEDDAVTVGSVGVTVAEFAAGGSNAVVDAAQAGLATERSGSIALTTLNGDIVANANVTGGAGGVAVTAARGITLGAGVTVSSGGALSLDAAGGALTMDGTANAMASGASLRLHAAGDIALGNVSATNVSVVSATGALLNAAGSIKNLSAVNLRLQADDAIGSAARSLTTAVDIVSAASAGSDSAGIYLAEDDAIATGSVAVSVGTAADAAQADIVSGNNGNIVLTTVNGSITVNDGNANGAAVQANGSGQILLQAGGADLVANAGVSSGSGNLTIKAAGGITLGAGVTVSTGGASLSLDAAGGALTMDGAANATAIGGNLRLHAAGDITLGNVSAANVSVVSATGALLNAAGSSKNVSAETLRLQAGAAIGTAARSLSTAVGTLSAHAASEIHVTEDDAVTIGSVGVTVAEFAVGGSNAVVDAAQAGLATERSGSIALTTLNGDIVANANVTGGAGGVTVTAARGITLGAGVTVSSGGALSLDAAGGALTMDGTANAMASGASLRLHAAGDIALGNVSATNVSVVSATGALLNAAGSIKNLSAVNLRLQADDAIGSAARSLTTAVDIVSAASAGSDSAGIYLAEDDAIATGSVAVSVGTAADAAQADIVSGNNGNIVLTTVNGSITVNDGNANGAAVQANGSGQILLQAGGADLVANAGVSSGSGNLTIKAAGGITLGAGVTVSTGGASLSLDAAGGALTMDGAANATAIGGNLRLHAAGDITLGNVSAANVSVVSATGALLNAAGSSKNVSAETLRLQAGAAIGTAARSLSTAVGTLSAHAASEIHVTEDDAVTIGSVGVTVAEFAVGGSNAVVDAAQAGLATERSGSIALTTLNGDIVANASVTGGAGGVAVTAARGIVLAGGVTVSSGGALSLDAAGGALTMDGTANAMASGASLRLHAAGDIALGNVSATNVSVVSATGALLNAAGSVKNISAQSLRLQAAGDIGAATRSVTTAVGTVAGSAANLWLREDDGITVGSAGGGVDAALSGLLSGAKGSIVLTTLAGDLAVASVLGGGVSATLQASGNIALGIVSAATVNLNAGAAVVSAGGGVINVTADTLNVVAGGAVGAANASLLTTVGTLNATAASIDLGESDSVIANIATGAGSASIRLSAGADIVARSVVAKGGDIRLTAGGNIVTEAGGVVGGDELRLIAGIAVGSGSHHLATSVLRLGASAASGGIYVTDRDDVQISGLDAKAGNAVVVSNTGNLRQDGTVFASGNVLFQAVAGTVNVNAALAAGGSVSLLASGLIEQHGNMTAGASIDVQAGGNLTMFPGTLSSAANLRYAAGGQLLVSYLRAADDGAVSLSAGGNIWNVFAPQDKMLSANVHAGSLRVAAGMAVGGAGNPLFTDVAHLAVVALAGGVTVREANGLDVPQAGVVATVQRVGADGATSAVTDAALAGATAPAGDIALSSSSGAVVFGLPLATTPGQNLNLVGDSFVVNQPLSGQGGELRITPSNAAHNIQVGGTPVAGALNLEQGSLANIAGGFGSIVIGGGSAAPGQDISIDGSSTPVVFNDGVVLNVSGSGSVISVAGQLTAEALDARGAVSINGAVTISAGNGAGRDGGDMVFEQSIDGGTAGAQLTLAAGGDSVQFSGAVGAATPLAALSIANAANVTFSQAVVVDGTVTINASGTVRFDSTLVLNGGSVVIRGASAVMIGDVLMSGKDGMFVIEANTLTLNGDVKGAAAVVLRPADSALAIDIGGAGVTGGYNVTAAQLAHLATVGSLVIGTQGTDGHAAAGAGTVSLAAIDLRALTAAPVAVYGGIVTVAAGAGTLQAAAGLTLDGRDGIVLQDSVGAAAGNVVLYSASGAITMAATATVSGAAEVALQAAGNLGIGHLQGDHVVLSSGSGTIADAAANDAVNIVANKVSIYGYGPKVGSGNAVQVQAPVVYVSAPAGMVLQDTGNDGRTHFYALDGATMYEQVIGVGNVVRQVEVPPAAAVQASALVLSQSLVLQRLLEVAASPALFRGSALAASDSGVAAYLSGLGNVAVGPAAGMGQDGLLVAGTQGLSRWSGASFTLGSPGQQALSTGAAASDSTAFDFWLEDVTV